MKRSSLRIGAGVLVAALLTVGTAALSRVPVTFAPADRALLRLSWRVESVSLQDCRERTPEELARLPVHMRNPRACIGTLAPYELRVRVDSREVVRDTARAPGARGDRPIPVFAELPLTPGNYQVEVRFDAILPEGIATPDGVTNLDWEGTVRVSGREVALLTTNDNATALVLRVPAS